MIWLFLVMPRGLLALKRTPMMSFSSWPLMERFAFEQDPWPLLHRQSIAKHLNRRRIP
jgi:hypothetical protein